MRFTYIMYKCISPAGKNKDPKSWDKVFLTSENGVVRFRLKNLNDDILSSLSIFRYPIWRPKWMPKELFLQTKVTIIRISASLVSIYMFSGMPNSIKCKKVGPDTHRMRYPIWRPKRIPKKPLFQYFV